MDEYGSEDGMYCMDCYTEEQELKKCSRCKCEVEDEDFEMYGGYCEGCGIHLCNAEIAKYGAPEWDNYNDRSAEL